MIRSKSIIIFLTVFLSACCEKEGSFLNTLVKKRTAEIAAVTKQQPIVNTSASTLNANAAAVDNSATQELSNNPETTEENTDKLPTEATAMVDNSRQLETITEMANTDPDSPKKENKSAGKDTVVEVQTSKIEQLDETAPSATDPAVVNAKSDTTPVLTDKVVNEIVDTTASTEPETEKNKNADISLSQPLNSSSQQKTKPDNISEVENNEQGNTEVEKIIEQTKSKPTFTDNQTELDKNEQLRELLAKDIEQQQVQEPNAKMSNQSLELLNDILSE